LGADIPSINNQAPKPYFIQVTNENKLLMAVDDTYPTQAFVTAANNQTIDAATFFDVSNRGDDNTPVRGLALDYDVSIAGTDRQIYIIDTSGDTPSVRATRANVGVKDGYTMASVPANEAYQGGVKFVSTDNTVRLFNGNFQAPIATSLDNLKTDNWAQAIEKSLKQDLMINSGMYAIYHDFKYHLAVNEKVYVFDIRNQTWSYLKILTENNIAYYKILSVVEKNLYGGQRFLSLVDKFYTEVDYRSEELSIDVDLPVWAYGEDLKHFQELHIYYEKGYDFTLSMTISIPGDDLGDISQTITFTPDGAFSSDDYSSTNYDTGEEDDDYIVIYLNRYGRGFQIKDMTSTGVPKIKAFRLLGRTLTNKEIA
jgi:hypothetical protein